MVYNIEYRNKDGMILTMGEHRTQEDAIRLFFARSRVKTSINPETGEYEGEYFEIPDAEFPKVKHLLFVDLDFDTVFLWNLKQFLAIPVIDGVRRVFITELKKAY